MKEYEPHLEAEQDPVSRDLAIGLAGAALAEIARQESGTPDQPFRPGLDESMTTDLLKATDPRCKAEEYHNNRPVNDKAVFDVAVKLDFVRPEILEPNNETEAKLGIHSDPEFYAGPAQAVLVPAGAGLTNPRRLYHALRSIAIGAAKTDRIIIATGQRATTDAEKAALAKANLRADGDSEYEAMLNAVRDIAKIDPIKATDLTVNYDQYQLSTKHSEAYAAINGQQVKIDIIEGPIDPNRKLADGSTPTRAITSETLTPLTSLLNDRSDGAIYLVSHDIWQTNQEIITRQTLPGYTVVGSGPQLLDRISKDPETGKLRLNKAGDVQFEIRKYLEYMLRTLDQPTN